jgi:hypothetical protein
VSILVRSPHDSNVSPCLIAELKKHAEIGGYDYVSTENIGPGVAAYLCQDGSWDLYEAKPRYFRKVALDDL